MLGDDSCLAPPESISNSEVKRTSADDSVGFPHVKVGYRQALFFILSLKYLVSFLSLVRLMRRMILSVLLLVDLIRYQRIFYYML